MKRLISMFTMNNIGSAFVDKVSGNTVCYYIDKYGDRYMAEYPYIPFNFRMKQHISYDTKRKSRRISRQI